MTRKTLASECIQLGFAVPEVLAHRLTRIDPLEFHRMSSEKVWAFHEAWAAMATQTFLESQKFFWFPWSVLAKGMAPVRRRAVANARRLRRRHR